MKYINTIFNVKMIRLFMWLYNGKALEAKLVHNLAKIWEEGQPAGKTLRSRRSLACSLAETVMASQQPGAARLQA